MTSGQITLGGKPLQQLTQEMIRSKISYVPQKAFLFSGTILSNLHMGNEHATEEELTSAIRISQLEEVLDKLPKKLASFVAQGGDNYSGGQKQRVAIARALAMNPRVLAYDEPTSALDPELRQQVERLILSLKEDGVTQIIVTHDLVFAENVGDQLLKVSPIR